MTIGLILALLCGAVTGHIHGGGFAFPDVNESTAYAILCRLLGDGKLAVTQGQESEGASRRKYYSLTELGNRSLEEARESWREISRTVAGFGI